MMRTVMDAMRDVGANRGSASCSRGSPCQRFASTVTLLLPLLAAAVGMVRVVLAAIAAGRGVLHGAAALVPSPLCLQSLRAAPRHAQRACDVRLLMLRIDLAQQAAPRSPRKITAPMVTSTVMVTSSASASSPLLPPPPPAATTPPTPTTRQTRRQQRLAQAARSDEHAACRGLLALDMANGASEPAIADARSILTAAVRRYRYEMLRDAATRLHVAIALVDARLSAGRQSSSFQPTASTPPPPAPTAQAAPASTAMTTPL